MPRRKVKGQPEGEPTQRTKTGYEIPVPKTEDFERLLKKAAEKAQRPGKEAQGRR